MNEKRLEPEKITALYERLSRDDEQIGGRCKTACTYAPRNPVWFSVMG